MCFEHVKFESYSRHANAAAEQEVEYMRLNSQETSVLERHLRVMSMLVAKP
jgi:hypothetical protein